MKKSIELAQKITALKNGVQGLIDIGNALEAEEKSKELISLVDEYNRVVAAENAVENNFINNISYGGKNIMDAKMKNRVFNKVLLGKNLTAEEAEYAKTLTNTVGTGQNETVDTDGGVLVPEDHYAAVKELKKQYIPLANLCWNYKTKSGYGTIPTLAGTTGKLVSFDELNALTANKVAFGKAAFRLGLHGDLIPVSNALLKDADVNVIDVIGRVFAKKAVNTENADIIDLCMSVADSTSTYYDATAVKTGSDYKAINAVLNKYLDPAASANATIITNQSGFDYLDGIVDGELRPLLSVSLVEPTQKLYKGRPVVVLPDADLENIGNALPFIVGDLEDAIAFVTNEGLEVAVSTEAGFTAYATMLRAIERYDVVFTNSKAVGIAEITPE